MTTLHREPDAFEKRVRFGCGFVFGAVLGIYLLLREIHNWGGATWAAVGGIAIACGLAAVRFGDEFWSWIRAWWRH
ncbi:MAG: hypothetical protein HMLKMBBP_02901 [Planctomycetes bacterium]|nr:hypothetical protein [Planctomycetota bacterium]